MYAEGYSRYAFTGSTVDIMTGLLRHDTIEFIYRLSLKSVRVLIQ